MLFAYIFADSEVRKIVASFVLLSVVIGLLSMIYNVKKLPILAQTLIHMGGSFLAFIVAAGVNQWFPFNGRSFYQHRRPSSLSFCNLDFLLFEIQTRN